MKNSNIKIMVEGAAMAALATVLSLIKVYELPWGGAITLLSMLPIVLFSIRRGLRAGFTAAFAYSLVQLALDLGKVIGWGLTPFTLIACLFLDYIAAFSVLGVAGIFRKKGMVGWISGICLALIARFAVHFVSGVWLWHSFGELWNGFSTENTYLYSFLYNGSYMLPELIFTLIGAVVLFKAPQTKKYLLSDCGLS